VRLIIKNIFMYFCLIFFVTNISANEVFVSLKKSKVNVRYGPSFDSDIKYVYKKINLPLKQIDKKENFRRIIDFKKNTGWIHVSQLKKNNSTITTNDKILFTKPTFFTKPIAQIEKGRLLLIEKCQKKWCKVKTGQLSGWIDKNNIWGSNYVSN